MTAHLIISEPLPVADPLAGWRWKIGGAARIVALSRSGDAFVSAPDGGISWLDTGGGDVSQVADSRVAFDRLLANSADATRLLLSPVVEEVIRLHGPFPLGTCLSFSQLPVLGGAYTVENRYRLSAVEHFGVTGDIHRQIRDLPHGAKVDIRVVD